MPTILLIRHGENDYVAKGRLAGRLAGVHLNQNGQKQSEMLAQALAQAPICAIYSSPLERCLETAQPLADVLGQELIEAPGLLEVDFGEWQDQTLKDLRRSKLWQVVQGNPARMCFPGGETFASAQQRIVQQLEALCQQHTDPQDLIACFSHSDLIKLALSYYLGQPLDLFQRIAVAPASLSVLHLGLHGAQILAINHSPTGFNFPKPKPAARRKTG